jgi:predicted deacetylase
MKKSLKIFLIILISLVVLLFLIRLISPREIDDVNPMRNCSLEYLEKADVFWVIPYYLNVPISENKTWCAEILSMNKTLGLHGYTHEYHEFETDISEEEFNNATEIFYDCFGFYPEVFKAPNLALSEDKKEMVLKKNLEIKGVFNQYIHKVYHCNEAGIFSNRFHDIF